MEVSLIIPACNEAARLRATLVCYERALRERYGEHFEIIVVANGCTDDTAQVASGLASALRCLRVIDIAEPVGKGGAVLEGFRQARGERLLFADADAPVPPASLLALLEQLARNDVVIGSRRLPASVVIRQPPLQRRVCGGVFAAAVRLLFGLPYGDTQFGAKALRRAAGRRLASVVRETRWTFDVELLLAARVLGLTVAEHPVTWTHSPGSRLRIVPAAREVVPALWRMKRRYARAAPRALPGLAASLGDAALTMSRSSGHSDDVETAGLPGRAGEPVAR